jgi:hypothetical protein
LTADGADRADAVSLFSFFNKKEKGVIDKTIGESLFGGVSASACAKAAR